MSALDRIAFNQGRRDEVPNKELAIKLAQSKDKKGIDKIARNLWNPNQRIRADCVKVLCEIGASQPQLIGDYAEQFVKLLGGGDNRLVWGGMTALAAISPLQADLLCRHLDTITGAIRAGSVITRDQGVKVLAGLATSESPCGDDAFAFLLEHLKTCRPKDVPQHSESALPAVERRPAEAFLDVLQRRLSELSPAQAKRVSQVIQKASAGHA